MFPRPSAMQTQFDSGTGEAYLGVGNQWSLMAIIAEA